ncbi:MAG TPA: VCBS repeat-containing protein [Chthoniobacteraceae bacterium]|jgi:hypothetical protein|nr:VCBS repeat-containing protein [Chthoniobacteraceae bacterium]
MKLPEAQTRLSRPRPIIEPLEQRIAPALLITGANLLGGPGNPTTGQGSIGGNSVTLVTVLSGEAIVWYDHGSIDAISFGPNTSLNVVGDVGALIGNLNANGTLTSSTGNAIHGLDGDVLLANNLIGLTTHPLGPEKGSVGEIITGGSVSNVNIAGDLSGIYAGDGAFKTQSSLLSNSEITVNLGSLMDINPVVPGNQYQFNFTSANEHFLSGASISNIKIGAAESLQVFAGDGAPGTVGSPGHPGNPGLIGGSITNITITSAYAAGGTPSYYLLAGDGGSGSKGGAGGSIQNITELASSGVVQIIAGAGGNGSSGAGGVGGSIKNLAMNSDSSAYTVHAGAGGNGSPGGAGGSVKGVNFGGNQLSNGIVLAAPFTNSGVDNILLVDAQTGTMVIEQNDHGLGWTPVVQDPNISLDTIASEGSTPIAAVAVDVNNDGYPDIVVAYKNSDNLGIYINQGGVNSADAGMFYTINKSGGNYTGDTLDAASLVLSYSPTALAAGDFTGDSNQDLAVALNFQGTPELLTLAGNGQGGFTPLTTLVTLPATPLDLIPAIIQGGAHTDLFASFKTGEIDALLSTGSSTGAPFNDIPTGITVPGGIANIDWDQVNPAPTSGETGGLLMALATTGNSLYFYTPSTAGTLTLAASVPLTGGAGTPLVAHFVPLGGNSPEPVEVLYSVGSGSRLDVYSAQGETYTFTSSISSTESLKNFAPVVEGQITGLAAIGTSVEHFAFSQNGGAFTDISLPFSGKTVTIAAGNGGNGVNGNAAAGGAGGSISGMTILAGQITLAAGNGGSSINAAAGVGGTITDTPTITVGTQTISAILQANTLLDVQAGSGGSVVSGTAHSAHGGVGGVVEGLNLSMLSGNLVVDSGNGGNGTGGVGGAGGDITAIKAVDNGGDLDLTAGVGGTAEGATGNGGAGGSISELTYSLAPTDLTIEMGYNVNLIAGGGGNSNGGTGGAGGAVQTATLTLEPANESYWDSEPNPPLVHADIDSTVRVTVIAGNGGSGATGGAGGAVKSISSTSVFTQVVTLEGSDSSDAASFLELNPVAATISSGSGGAGSKGAGGAGGSVTGLTLTGISHYDLDSADPQTGAVPLVITSGAGGNGATNGGAGGAITGVVSQNSQFNVSGTLENISSPELSAASVTSGAGGNGGTGNGGAGGTVSNLSIGVSGFDQSEYLAPLVGQNMADIVGGGQITIISGAGGNGGHAARGGAAGSIIGSVVGVQDAFEDYGILLQGGLGGNGGLGGGQGGNVANIQVSSPENPIPATENYDVLSTLILAGNGGQATAAGGIGGTGGSIGQIMESKDVNSPINILQAGNGGAAVTTGGTGGSVIGVSTVGLIGQPSDLFYNSFGVFQTDIDPGSLLLNSLFPYNGGISEVPQGVFAGNGGAGATAGAQGSVMSISAAQIAAIGAAMNADGTFGAAARIASITAQAIAYDQNGNGQYDNVTGTNRTAPDQAIPIDGFIFSETAPTGINTLSNAQLAEFTFVS